MRRVWAAVVSVWALLALVAVLAWTRPVVAPQQAVSRVVVTNGTRSRVMFLPSVHATTQTSPGAAAGGTQTGSPQAAPLPAAAPQATTRSS
jgi:hypothetical protein